MPYQNDPINNTTDAVRLEIADTTEERELVSDQEVAYALSKESDNVLKAAARCCEIIMARYAREGSRSGPASREDKSQLMQHYKALANRLRGRSTGSSAFITNLDSVSGHDARRTDTGIVQPSFRRGMQRNDSTTTSSKASDDPSV